MYEVGQWIAARGIERKDVARLAGVARSTLHRVETGAVSPSLDTLREIAAACGLALDLTTRPLSDPAAAEAARLALEDGYVPTDPAAAALWTERLARATGTEPDPIDLLLAAAQAADLTWRPEAWHLSGSVPPGRVVSAADGATYSAQARRNLRPDEPGGRWALSGAPALGTPSGPVILWTENPEVAGRLLAEDPRLRPAPGGVPGDVIVARAHDGIWHDVWTEDRWPMVAPIQMLLDCLPLPALREAALTEARSW